MDPRVRGHALAERHARARGVRVARVLEEVPALELRRRGPVLVPVPAPVRLPVVVVVVDLEWVWGWPAWGGHGAREERRFVLVFLLDGRRRRGQRLPAVVALYRECGGWSHWRR